MKSGKISFSNMNFRLFQLNLSELMDFFAQNIERKISILIVIYSRERVSILPAKRNQTKTI